MTEISITNIENISIGQTENREAGTGCTVFVSKDGMSAGIDIRGGGPAGRETQLLDPLAAASKIHAIVLAGGSAFGLGAADGVMKYLEEQKIGFDVGVTKVPLVVQSDLFDLTVLIPETDRFDLQQSCRQTFHFAESAVLAKGLKIVECKIRIGIVDHGLCLLDDLLERQSLFFEFLHHEHDHGLLDGCGF